MEKICNLLKMHAYITKLYVIRKYNVPNIQIYVFQLKHLNVYHPVTGSNVINLIFQLPVCSQRHLKFSLIDHNLGIQQNHCHKILRFLC